MMPTESMFIDPVKEFIRKTLGVKTMHECVNDIIVEVFTNQKVE